MRYVFSNILPFKGFLAMNLFGVIFIRSDEWMGCPPDQMGAVVMHEAIHSAQAKELLWIPFYIIYVCEWIAKLFVYGRDAYDHISFEKEAYAHMHEKDYLDKRKRYAQWRKSS